MQLSSTAPVAPFLSQGLSRAVLPGVLLVAGLFAACGGSSGGSGQSGIPGTETLKPGGGTFFVDPNQSGGAANLHLAEILWGRLVDVFQVDAGGERVETPVFSDMVIEQGILTDNVDYVLDRNPVTQRERLTILHRKTGVADTEDFDAALAAARDGLPVVSTKDVTSSPPFTTIPRNACLSLRFDDCLDDDLSAAQNLVNTVNVVTGYPPVTPFSARVVFDPNHGAVVGPAFHTTRVLIDLTTSESEPAVVPLDVNPIGLPASLTTSSATNAVVRIPSLVDLGSGQFQVLTNLAGVALDSEDNGPVDEDIPTLDIVRAVKSGNPEDPEDSNGFLRDKVSPRVIGSWPVTVTAAADDPAGDPGLDFLLDLTFTTDCRNAPQVGDVVTVGDAFLVVGAAALLSGTDVDDLEVRAVAAVSDPDDLLGSAQFQAPFDNSLTLEDGCWVSFLPLATTFPALGVSTTAQVVARFSEPMDPASLSPFDNFLVVDGVSGAASTAISSNIIVGDVLPNDDLTQFSFNPSAPYPHVNGQASNFKHVELSRDATDLAGNRLRHQIPFVDFVIEASEPTDRNDSVVLRLDRTDEYAPNGNPPDGLIDLRGQLFYDTLRGSVIPRPVSVTGWPVDRTNPVPSLMSPVVTGVFNPLNPLGAKVHQLWRYCDLGWNVRDETKYNLDVLGLNWAPVGGQVKADFFEEFEIRLGHSRFLPDEAWNLAVPPGPIPLYPPSGVPPSPARFDDSYLGGVLGATVHNRALGYTVNPADLFNAATALATPMMPYPLNRGGGTDVTFTWRDTTILTLGADGDPAQPGIPLDIEVYAGVEGSSGSIAGAGAVPIYGLPLLIEVRCFPADQGLGLNAFDVSLANALSPTPNFRAYSAGGINVAGSPVQVLPDREDVPRGGFNPLSTPPGKPTSTTADNVFYIGQLDTVVKVSRVHTAWLDAGVGVSPAWRTPVLEPSLAGQPAGTNVLLAFRSASGFSTSNTAPFNAATFDVFGNQTSAVPLGATDWSSSNSVGNGKRYLQVRLTFVNNIATGLSPELTAIAFPYDIQ